MDDNEGRENRRTPGRRDYDNTNIVKLKWVNADSNQSTVDALKSLLALAESGELIGISYAALTRVSVRMASVGAMNDQRLLTKGALIDLANQI